MNENTILGTYKRTLSTEPWSPPGVSLIAARKMWASNRGKGAIVAVLDTGIDDSHTDLKNNVMDGKSFVDSEKSPKDENGHGTHVAGTIAANGKLLGVAPEARLLAVKVLDKRGMGSYTGINQGLEWTRKWKGPAGETVQVINMSLGGPVSHPGLQREIARAVKAGITVVCAAGNSGDGREQTREISFPAYYPETIAVGAVDLHTGMANFSNSNDKIDVVAPGVETYSTYPGQRYVKLSGTSMATPHISGAATLICARYHQRFGSYPSPQTVQQILQYMSIDLGKVGFDELYGYGLFSFNLDGGQEIRLIAGRNEYYINGKAHSLNTIPQPCDDSICAPLGEIAPLLGCDCNYAPAEGSKDNPSGEITIWR